MAGIWTEVAGRPLDVYRKMDGGTRTLVLGLLAVGLVAVIVGGMIASRTSWRLLYDGLEPGDAASVVASLERSGIEHKVSDGGLVYVAEGQVARARMRLAEDQLPRSGTPGYELFDNSDFNLSQDEFYVRHKRAIMGHLTETIESLEAVRKAVVSISLPKRTTFIKRHEQRPAASITLQMKPGARLSDDQIAALVFVVTGSVGHGIRESDVKITDQSLRLIWPLEGPGGQLAMHAGRDEEMRLEEKAHSLLVDALGPGKSSVRVSLEMDTTYEETQREVRDPKNKVPVKETSNTSSTVADAAAGGAASVDPPQGGDSLTKRSDEDTITENIAGVEHSLQIRSSPTIKRMTVALALDKSDEVLVQSASDLETMVKKAVGFNDERDDFSMTLVPFAEIEVVEEPEVGMGITDYIPLADHLVEAVTVLFVLFLLVKTLKGGKKEADATTVTDPGLDPNDPRVRLARLVEQKPDQARLELLNWLQEDARN